MGSLPPNEQCARAFVLSAQSFLQDEYLPKIERCLKKLSVEQVWYRPNPHSNSIGNLILHLCGNARQWVICGLGNQFDERRRDEEFATSAQTSITALSEHLHSTISEVVAVLQSLDPATMLQSRTIQGCDVDVLEAIFHVTEHFSMHTGQIIVLTKMITDDALNFYDFSSGKPEIQW